MLLQILQYFLVMYYIHIFVLSTLCIFCMPLPIQSECERLTYRVQTLESELTERIAHCEELKNQCEEEAENCRLMKVSMPSMLNCSHT